MKPSPGRIVLYCFRDRGCNALVERPAIVTSVDEFDETVNLTVFFECTDEDACSRGRSGDLDSNSRYIGIPQNHGDVAMPETWRWPPRV